MFSHYDHDDDLWHFLVIYTKLDKARSIFMPWWTSRPVAYCLTQRAAKVEEAKKQMKLGLYFKLLETLFFVCLFQKKIYPSQGQFVCSDE